MNIIWTSPPAHLHGTPCPECSNAGKAPTVAFYDKSTGRAVCYRHAAARVPPRALPVVERWERGATR